MDVGAAASVGSVADSYDNAMAEALNGTFKAELIELQGPWRDADQVERAVVQWVGWYNTERLHSALDYLPPEEFEAAYYRSLATPNAPETHKIGRYETRGSSVLRISEFTAQVGDCSRVSSPPCEPSGPPSRANR